MDFFGEIIGRRLGMKTVRTAGLMRRLLARPCKRRSIWQITISFPQEKIP